jgi:hypothetical protein
MSRTNPLVPGKNVLLNVSRMKRLKKAKVRSFVPGRVLHEK